MRATSMLAPFLNVSGLTRLGLAAAFALSVTGTARAETLPLVPYPASVKTEAGALALPPVVGVTAPKGDRAALADARWLADEAGRIGGLTLKPGAAHGLIAFRRQADPNLGAEGYRLDIGKDGVRITAPSDAGLFHGAATLLQLLTPKPGEKIASLPLLHIEDKPRFAWRGVMLDSVRHMQSVAFIERFLDQMARYKLNTFHWHLTDDQGWRLQIRKYPRLTEVGGWRVEAGEPHGLDIDAKTGRPHRYGGFYTQAQVRAVVAYAQARGITVVPEIELPGHASAAIYAYPALGLKPVDPATMGDWGVFPNLYAPNDHTLGFLQDVLTEVMALFPSRYIHVGGDEAVKTYWKTSPQVQAQIRRLGLKDEDELQSWMTNRIGRFLQAHGRKLIGWDEILQGDLPQGATVMSWRGAAGGVQAARMGHDAVLTPGLPFYFDNRLSPANDEPPGRGLIIKLSDVYAYDPTPPSMDEGVAAHILGVQANIWTEHIRLEARVEYMAFPRAAAVAEMGWSPQSVRVWPDFLVRLKPAMGRDVAVGLVPSQSALDPRPTPPAGPNVRDNHQLALCTEAVSLNLEAPGPVSTEHRATVLADIMNPCWIWKGADLTDVSSMKITAADLPFNFQIGAAAAKVPLTPQATPNGELMVRLDDCKGPLIATAPMPITGADPVAAASAPLTPQPGRHNLCFTFTRARLDPWWALGSVELVRQAAP